MEYIWITYVVFAAALIHTWWYTKKVATQQAMVDTIVCLYEERLTWEVDENEDGTLDVQIEVTPYED